MPSVLEFWPEYNGGPLWTADGSTADLASLGLNAELRSRLGEWNSRYDDSKVSFEMDDTAWLAEGTSLLEAVRTALGADYDIVVMEPWWGEDPSA